MLAINEVLQQGRYRITDQFGQDTVGAGYEAFDNTQGKIVLLKEIFVSSKKNADALPLEIEKIASVGEVKLLTELKHESLLGIGAYFSEADRQYLVLESIDGSALSELAEKKKTFSVSQTVNWAEHLLDALHYLHTQKPSIIHRDVKPQNIILTSEGKIKLLAFGNGGKTDENASRMIASQMFDPAALPYSPLELIWGRLDRASQNVITNSYDEASEKILNLPADARSDIYSLGATLYHLLTARIPIDALERSIDILEGKADPLLAPNRINAKIPSEISYVVMKALEIKRENRFDSALIMRQVLRTAFARAKEREAQELKKQEDILEIPFAEPKKIEPKRQLDEQRQQNELIRQQLRESEANRLKAEQRAAEAERRLIEKEKKDFDSEKSLAAIAESVRESTRTPLSATVKTEPSRKNIASANSSEDFKDLFVQPPKNNKILWRMAVTVLILVTLSSGGFFGFQSLKASETAELNRSELNQAILDETEPAPVEAVIEANAETQSETVAVAASETPSEPMPETVSETPFETQQPLAASETRNFVEPIVRRKVTKNKPAAQTLSAPRVEKQTPPPVKIPIKQQKKAITVDDIINDN